MIFDFDKLLSIYDKEISKNTKNKKKIYYYDLYKFSNLYKLMDIDISNFNIKYNIFYIKDPKYRIIMSMNISSKIISHYMAKYILLPKINKYLDIRNVASRKNMGYSYAVKLLYRYIEKNKKYKDFYVLKLDISKYFYSIDHNVLKLLLIDKLDNDEYDMICNFIDSTNDSYINDSIINIKNKLIDIDKNRSKEINSIPLYEYGKGLSIGSVVNQILSIFYLYKLDHYIVHNLHIKYYIRYVDDFILIHHDKEYLRYVYRIIEDILNREYKLKLNKDKCMIVNIRHGFVFLGSRYRVINNKTIVNICSKKRYRIRRNIKKKNYLYSRGYISYKSYYSSINSYSNMNRK